MASFEHQVAIRGSMHYAIDQNQLVPRMTACGYPCRISGTLSIPRRQLGWMVRQLSCQHCGSSWQWHSRQQHSSSSRRGQCARSVRVRGHLGSGLPMQQHPRHLMLSLGSVPAVCRQRTCHGCSVSSARVCQEVRQQTCVLYSYLCIIV